MKCLRAKMTNNHHALSCLCMVIATFLFVNSLHAEEEKDMSIHYGRIAGAEEVDVKKHTGEAALVGGTLGAMTYKMYNTGKTSGNLLLGSAAGAATGAGIEALGEWRMKGTRYAVETVDVGVLHIITDHTSVQVGDCVAIEANSKHANLRKVSDVYCESSAEVMNDPHINGKAKQAAGDCVVAKKGLLASETADELDQAKRRIRAFCD